jgi:signal peptidase I
MKLRIGKRTAAVLTAAIVAVLMLLPFLAGTTTYPVAIVQGNSMYPNLQNGDLVLFKHVDQQSVSNGTIIVFVQGNTGVTMLDSLMKPIVVHRVVGSLVQADGTVSYYTKGDNNQDNDSSAVPANHVLGAPALVIPKVGFLLLFLSSSQGLVATVGFITIFYLGSYEGKLKEDKAKESFLGELARMVVNGELPEEVFKKFEFAVKYASSAETGELKDNTTLAILDWLKRGALEKGWTIKKTICPECYAVASRLESNKNLLIICPRCSLNEREHTTPDEANQEKQQASLLLDNLEFC